MKLASARRDEVGGIAVRKRWWASNKHRSETAERRINEVPH